MPCCLANTNNNFLCFSVIFFAPSNFFLISSFFNLHWERQIIFSFTLFLYLFFFLFVCDKQLFFFRSHLVKYPPYNLDKYSESNLHHKLHSLSFYSYLHPLSVAIRFLRSDIHFFCHNSNPFSSYLSISPCCIYKYINSASNAVIGATNRK